MPDLTGTIDMEMKDPSKISGTIVSLHKTLRLEIRKERERYKELYSSGMPGRITLVIVGAAILANILILLTNSAYPLLFISSSFVLFMIYFITLLIPHNLHRATLPQTEIAKYLSDLYEHGVISSTKRFTLIFLNAFFINCRPLFYGFALIFSIVIALVIEMASIGILTPSHTWIILLESGAIILFYYLVWKLEPYTVDFFSGVTDMRANLLKKKVPAPVVSALFIVCAILALFGIITTLILLPGMTFNNILSVAELKQLSNLFGVMGVIIVTLYFIMRFIHGITSRELLNRFTKNKTDCLSRQIEITKDAGKTDNPDDTNDEIDLILIRKAAELLLETQIYQVEEKTLFGTFPVYIVNPDFSWIFAPTLHSNDET